MSFGSVGRRIGLEDIPTLDQLYQRGRLREHPSPAYQASAAYNAKISVIRTDITTLALPKGAIVNAANESCLGGGGVDGAIHQAAGPQLYHECKMLNGCPTGDAKITMAYELPCHRVIHSVGPIYGTRKRGIGHEQHLRSCYRRSLQLAAENGCDSVAFSALSTGVYGYPSGEAAMTALDEVRRCLDEGLADSIGRIIFCNFMPKDERAYNELLPKFFPVATTDPKQDEGSAATGSEGKSADTAEPTASQDVGTTQSNTQDSRTSDASVDEPDEPGEPAAKKLRSDIDADEWVVIDADAGADAGDMPAADATPAGDVPKEVMAPVDKGKLTATVEDLPEEDLNH